MVFILSSREGLQRGLWGVVVFLGSQRVEAGSKTRVAVPPQGAQQQHRAWSWLPVVDVRRLLTACVQLRERWSLQQRVRREGDVMRNLVVVDRRQELGRRQPVVVALPDGPGRTARAGMVVVRAVVQLLGYLAGEIPRIFVQSEALALEACSSCGLS